MAHWVYILKSLKDHKYYIGYTTNVEKRLDFHNAGRQRSTKNRTPFKLVYTEHFEDEKSVELEL
ncbi:MAG: GIY-YIG nuclease family protein [Bacteroidales bacterium]